MSRVFELGNGLEVVVHFGAHKTATTFLQQYLKSEMAELRRIGVGYVPLDVCRASIIPFVAQSVRCRNLADRPNADLMKESIAEVTEASQGDTPSIRRLLISDENLAGPTLALLNKGALYPAAASRLRVLFDQFPGVRKKLFFCIRDYADFIPSVYCELLRRHRLAPLGKILNRSRELSLSWPAFLADIAALLPDSEVYYWRYEDFSDAPADVVEAMTGVRLASIERSIAKKVRPSLTTKAVSVLHAARHHLTDEEHRRLAECLVDNMKFDVNEKVIIQDQSRREAFREQYRRDVSELLEKSEPMLGVVRRLKR